MRVNYGPKLIPHLIESGVLETEPVFLVDVGASGGIHGSWRFFGEKLRAVGFDPLVKEIARLNAEEQNPNGADLAPERAVSGLP